MNINRTFKGAVFDLDGTLVDTVADITDALNDTLEEYGKPKASFEDAMGWIGHGLGELIKNALKEDLKTKEKQEEAHKKIRKNYKRRWITKAKVYPGAKELIDFCNKNSIPVGVTSNKSHDATVFIINNLFKNNTFTDIKGLKEGMPRKPDPIQTLEVIREMGLKPEEILYIGDSQTDYKTAKNTGAFPVLVDYGYGDKEILKSYKDALYIHDLREVMDLFDIFS